MVGLRSFEACKIGDIETLKKLPHIEPTLVDSNGACCIHYAARGGSLTVVEYLVKTLNFSVLARTNTGATALHDAAAKGNTAIVKWLVESGDLNVNDQDFAGVTAIHLAARYCHFLLVEWLLDEASADASIRSNEGALPLHFAVVGGDMNCVKILVDENPRLINMQMNNGAAPIYLASQAGHLDILTYLINRNGATKVKAYDAMSCLHAAAQMGYLDIVKWLVTVDKCNPNDRDFDGATPLHFAAGRGHADVVRWLLKEGGARVTLDNLGGSPLHSASEMGELLSVQALLDCGCDINLTDNSGLTAAELADNCGQTQAAALIRGELTLSQLGFDSSSQLQNNQTHHQQTSHISIPPPPPPNFQQENSHFSRKSTYAKSKNSHHSVSPPLPPPPAQSHSISSTPSTVGSPITPPTPIHEEEKESVAALGYGHGSVKQLSRGVYNSSEGHPTIQRTPSRVSVDSSASNFGVFEQQDAGVIHTVTVEVHKTPRVVPPTPQPVTFSVVPGHGSLNSTQESIVFSTSNSSFSQDESSPTLDRKLVVHKTTRPPFGFHDKGGSEYSYQHLPSPPLAHSTRSSRSGSLQSDISAEATHIHDSSQNRISHSENQDNFKEITKFQYYSTPYKKDFNTVTRSSFAKAKALFQSDKVNSLQICPDSGEICTKSEIEYDSLNQKSSTIRMDAQRDSKPEENHVARSPIMSSSNSNHASQRQNSLKSVIAIQGNHSTIIATSSKPDRKEENIVTSSALISTQEPPASTAKATKVLSSVQTQKDDVMKELRNKNVSNISTSASLIDPPLANGHAKTGAASSSHLVHSSSTRTTPIPLQLAVNGNRTNENDRSTNPRNFSRSSSGSSTSSQNFSPLESKHNLIADIQSAVSGTSSLSLRRTKSRGEGISMVYQSKKGGAVQEETKVGHAPLTGQFDPKNFLDQVEKVDSSGRAIPEWRRQVLSKHLAEKAQKESEEKKQVEDYEVRFKDIPAWKRALIEKKEAHAREEAASAKK